MTFRWSDSPQSLARQFAGAAAALAGVSALLIALASWWWIDRLQNDAGQVIQRQEVELRATRFAEILSRVEERARELANSYGEWREISLELDALSGMDLWKMETASGGTGTGAHHCQRSPYSRSASHTRPDWLGIHRQRRGRPALSTARVLFHGPRIRRSVSRPRFSSTTVDCGD